MQTAHIGSGTPQGTIEGFVGRTRNNAVATITRGDFLQAQRCQVNVVQCRAVRWRQPDERPIEKDKVLHAPSIL
eukprot:6213353-Pleurochrysis_carterae.AAC.1